MIFETFKIILLIIIIFIPILLWGYLFSYYDKESLNKKRFFIGIFSGGISVLPILYLGDITKALNIQIINIFQFVNNIEGFKGFLIILISFIALITLIYLISIFSSFSLKNIKLNKIFVKYLGLFFIGLIVISILLTIIEFIGYKFPVINDSKDYGLKFGDIFFNSTKLVIFYYIIVGIIEESSKYFNFMQSSYSSITSIKKGVLYSVFIALGFSFFENILYIINTYNEFGINNSLIGVYLNRSIFSIILHIFCTSIISLAFSKMLFSDKIMSIKNIRTFIIAILIAFLLHGFFNISLTFGYSRIIFIYCIVAYFYITYVFYKNEEDENGSNYL